VAAMQVTGTITDGITAWSTLGAVLVALFSPAALVYLRYRRRPRLRVVFGHVEPLMSIEPSPADPKWVAVRAEIRNEGRTEAKRVRVQTRHCWLNSDVPIAGAPPWRDLVLLPLPLRWESRPSTETGRAAEEVDIARGMNDFVLVTRTEYGGDSPHHLASVDGVGKQLQPMYDVGEYRIELTVAAENARPVSAVVGYRRELAERVFKPHHADRPLADETESEGFLHFLNARSSDDSVGQPVRRDPLEPGNGRPRK
jgi:hypothetical protein